MNKDEEKEEKELILEVQKGNIILYEKLILKYQKKVYNLAYQLTKNIHDAEDLTQTALIKVYQSINKFKFKSAFSTYLYRIVYYTFLDEQKKAYVKQKKRELSLETITETQTQEAGVTELPLPSPETIDGEFEKQELQNSVRRAIDMLKPEFRIPIIMYHIQGFSYEEIAGAMNTSVGTVMSRLNRARQKLREILSKKK